MTELARDSSALCLSRFQFSALLIQVAGSCEICSSEPLKKHWNDELQYHFFSFGRILSLIPLSIHFIIVQVPKGT